MKEDLLAYYAVTGQIPALKMVLESHVDPNVTWGHVPLINHCFLCNQEEACLVLMNAGVDMCYRPETSTRDPRNFVSALTQGSYQFLKAIATHPGVTLDLQDSKGLTALYYASMISNHLGVAILLAAGASPIACNRNPIVKVCACGVVSVMETIVVYAKQHLNSTGPDDGFAAIHTATQYKVCNILAAQECVDINMRGNNMETPLHYAAARASWVAVECLVGWGAQLNVTDVNGDTPLHIVVGKKSPVIPDPVQLKMVYEELSRASGGRAVEGYIAVACFLVQEGADIHIKNRKGLSPYQMMSPDMASLITAYVKNHPGSFQGSLCNTRQRLMCELPQQSEASAVESPENSSKLLPGFLNLAVKEETLLVDVKTLHKDVHAMKQQTFTSSSVGGSQQSQASAYPTVESPENSSPNSQGQLCLLCEERPASVKFSPCGHTVMCSVCAERAKRCLQCKDTVESKEYV